MPAKRRRRYGTGRYGRADPAGASRHQEFIEAFGLTQDELAAVTAGKMELSPVSALKLAKFFGMSESYFFNLAARYSLDLSAKLAGEDHSFPAERSSQQSSTHLKLWRS